MTKSRKFDDIALRSTYNLIARKLGCTKKYVRMVLQDRLGKYNSRQTELVKKIREMAKKIESL